LRVALDTKNAEIGIKVRDARLKKWLLDSVGPGKVSESKGASKVCLPAREASTAELLESLVAELS
jgi:hypothetical protein